MNPSTVPVTPEWALWGKEPGDRGHRLLRCSSLRLGPEEFTEIVDRYSLGTHAELPQVTISWTRYGEEAYLGLAIQTWSDTDDRLGRPVAVTRYFAVPFYQLAAPVSYESLFQTFNERDMTADALVDLPVPVLQPDDIRLNVNEQTMEIAALLLTRTPVQILGADGTPLMERLRYLDTVASLLPYGMRSRLSAATWVSSTTEHNFRLAFTGHPRRDAHTVRWTDHANVPREADLAHRYLELLTHPADPTDLIARLAWDGQARQALSFKTDGHRAVAMLDEIVRSPRQPPGPVPERRTDPEVMLQRCADALDRGQDEVFENCVHRLQYIRGNPQPVDRQQEFRRTVRDRRLLTPNRRIPDGPREYFYEALVHIVYGPALTLEGYHQIQQDAQNPQFHVALLTAMTRIAHADPVVSLLIGLGLGGEMLRKILAGLDSATLVGIAARHPDVPALLDTAHGELVARSAQVDPSIAPALREHGFLAAPIARRYPGQPDVQLAKLSELLDSAYGAGFGDAEFREVSSGAGPHRPTGALIGAALRLYNRPGAGELLVDSYFGDMLRAAAFDPRTGKELLRRLAEPRPSHSVGPEASSLPSDGHTGEVPDRAGFRQAVTQTLVRLFGRRRPRPGPGSAPGTGTGAGAGAGAGDIEQHEASASGENPTVVGLFHSHDADPEPDPRSVSIYAADGRSMLGCLIVGLITITIIVLFFCLFYYRANHSSPPRDQFDRQWMPEGRARPSEVSSCRIMTFVSPSNGPCGGTSR